MKHFLYLLLVVFVFASCKSSHSSVSNSDKKTIELCNNLVDNAKDNLGSPYKFGGTTKNGFDCSGLVFTAYKKEEIILPRTSIEMSNYGKRIKKEDARKADLIFFKTGGSSKINHVGLIVDCNRDDIKFIHSSTKKGVIISSLKEDYYRKSFSHINRVIDN
ncbi:C40 family peptidase [Flavobacterium sp.]|uniref:C40 family peptidase n=1 Tax=Flavobacterium sp. TaxID=239 RepID=UPI00261960EC|nr:C40 family peptidase [Flavobacterium sp.]